MAALIVPTVPAGFIVKPDAYGDTGPSDFAKAVRDDGSPDAASTLAAAGFVRGYQRLWMNQPQDQIVVFIYQFRDAIGAHTYYARGLAEIDVSSSAQTTRFAVPGLPASSASGIRGTKDGGGFAEIAVAIKGPLVMEIVCNSAASAGLHARLVAVTQRQYRRL